MQAAAAGIEPTADMNPVLLKPGSDRRSQVVVLGHPEAEADAVGYRAHAPRLRQVALDSLARLRDAYDVVICEGAGSPAEINLRETDVANMGLARAAGLPVIVTGDIDRGGVFAAMYGTLALLSPEDQALISGFVINKFRGAPELLDSGLTMLRQLTGRPVYGVLPWQEGLGGDAEDSLALPPHGRSTTLDHGAEPDPFGTKIFSGSRWSGCPGSATSPTWTRWRPSPACWCGSPRARPTWPTRTWWCCQGPGLPSRTWPGCGTAGLPPRSPGGPGRAGRCSASAAATRCWPAGSTTRWNRAAA